MTAPEKDRPSQTEATSTPSEAASDAAPLRESSKVPVEPRVETEDQPESGENDADRDPHESGTEHDAKEQDTDREPNESTDQHAGETGTVDGDQDELIPVSDDEARVGTLVGERYRITELIGTGGMGAVYKAEHVHMRKLVALKVLHREMTIMPDVVARFEREAIAAGRIEHPNVVSARDFGRLEDGAYYLVLEYVEGEPLGYVLRKEQFTIGRSLHIALQIAEALIAAHEQDIVHRDLKPDNIMMLRPSSGFERIKVLDFGIAKVSVHERGKSQRPLTRIGSVFGTPEYMSPEQAAGQRVDARSDLYSLGLLLYRMISGHVPFKAEQLNAVLMMQLTKAPEPLPNGTPAPVQELVSKLLEKLPEARYQSAIAVANRIIELLDQVSSEDLTKSLAPPPVEAPLETLLGSGNRLAQRIDATFLGLPIRLGDNTIPLWRLTVVALVMSGLGAGLVTLLRTPEEQTTSAEQLHPLDTVAVTATTEAKPPPKELDAALEQLLALTFAGDHDALARLEDRPMKSRTTREWLAIGRGRAKQERHLEAMQAYGEALDRDPAAANDPALIKDVWHALNSSQKVDLALQICAEHLGSQGADMLYRVWVETKEITETTQTARKLLQKPEVRSAASPGLQFLLDWREAMSCDDYRRLLPRAAIAADSRALTLLQRAQVKNDCELSEEALMAAVAASKGRPSPLPY